MAKIEIHAGDFPKGKNSQFLNGTLLMDTGKVGWLGPKTEKVPVTELSAVEVASEESVKRAGGTVGWGIAGAVVLGPVGLLAGLLAGGRGKNVTFVANLKDGRKFLGTTDSKTYTKLQAAVF